ncbi:hypothetical protein VTO42DRAFT_7273 [Malbranchea cinnamomea]
MNRNFADEHLFSPLNSAGRNQQELTSLEFQLALIDIKCYIRTVVEGSDAARSRVITSYHSMALHGWPNVNSDECHARYASLNSSITPLHQPTCSGSHDEKEVERLKGTQRTRSESGQVEMSSVPRYNGELGGAPQSSLHREISGKEAEAGSNQYLRKSDLGEDRELFCLLECKGHWRILKASTADPFKTGRRNKVGSKSFRC